MKRPDFFVGGAPKCGTTALSDYLKRHPSFPRPTLSDYLGYFVAAGREKRRVGLGLVMFRTLRLRPRRSGRGYWGWLKRPNSKPAPVRTMSPAFREALQREFAPEVERLSELLGRDFTHWCRA